MEGVVVDGDEADVEGAVDGRDAESVAGWEAERTVERAGEGDEPVSEDAMMSVLATGKKMLTGYGSDP